MITLHNNYFDIKFAKDTFTALIENFPMTQTSIPPDPSPFNQTLLHLTVTSRVYSIPAQTGIYY
jgi:hypothetical protein